MSLVGQYSDSDSDSEEDKVDIKTSDSKQGEDNDIEDNKIPISKVNEKPYGLIITEETTKIINKDTEEFNLENDDQDRENEDSPPRKEIDGDEIIYQVADSENDRLNQCHTILHTKLENRDIDIPKEMHEPKTPVLKSPAYVSTPPHSKDPNFKNLYPHNITSPITEDIQDEEEKEEPNDYISFLPPPVNGRADPILEDKIIKYHKMREDGISINQSLRESQSFRNPSILEKLIAFCEISEMGSNYKLSEYDPNGFKPDEFYEVLNENQRKMDDKREYERLNRTKIDFVSSTNELSTQEKDQEKDKQPQKPKKKFNKWEKEKHKQKQQQLQQQQQKAKATVISAAPSIMENPGTQSTTTTSTTKSESLLKRFKTSGF
ncbi:hypothetical protein DICPUDRAFT_31489 [Dictyostelium purpureum]|uniref:SAP30-binding protein n=1 Tax=Dictyostelium purpureum TaxID=5786 RepID=F0ZH86_DICPU|nr:uncharacterized protein DICPUDRAFT_31489 [Dictyostelium purpureum]EGC36679.1 hypothetical protein DICPUDRAFT_31489 [Dictyostelium purpureum]|eukprot:XP_003286778.1 hypothetical protein DICPUDRAFT_31489 [Dictyostelium purpureum]